MIAGRPSERIAFHCGQDFNRLVGSIPVRLHSCTIKVNRWKRTYEDDKQYWINSYAKFCELLRQWCREMGFCIVDIKFQDVGEHIFSEILFGQVYKEIA